MKLRNLKSKDTIYVSLLLPRSYIYYIDLFDYKGFAKTLKRLNAFREQKSEDIGNYYIAPLQGEISKRIKRMPVLIEEKPIDIWQDFNQQFDKDAIYDFYHSKRYLGALNFLDILENRYA